MSYKIFLVLILPFTAFLIFFTDSNTELFLAINQSGKAFPDIFWEILTTFGNKPFVLTVLFLVTWKKPDLLVSALIASIFAGLISSTLKPLFDLARPTDILNISSYHLIGAKISGHSFPSGHTMSAFAVASSLIFFYKKSFVTVTMFLLASLVGLSRIMLGVHWPIDVLIGATLGLACAYLGVQLALHPWLRLKEHKLKSSVVTMLYLLLSLKLFLTGTGYASVQGMVLVIAILGIGLGIALILYRLRKNIG